MQTKTCFIAVLWNTNQNHFILATKLNKKWVFTKSAYFHWANLFSKCHLLRLRETQLLIVSRFLRPSFGICPHLTDDNKDQLKGKDLLVAYYDVDYDKNPKGSNYWRNRWASRAFLRTPRRRGFLHTLLPLLPLSTQGDEGGQGLPGPGEEAELRRRQQEPVQPRPVRLRHGRRLWGAARRRHPHRQGRQIRHERGVLVSAPSFTLISFFLFVCFFGFFPLISLVFVTCSRDGKALERFLQDYFDGKLKRYLKSEAVPETNDGPVKVRDSWIGCLTMSTLFPLIARNGKYGF